MTGPGNSEFTCVSSYCDRKVERFAMRQLAALSLFSGSIDDMLHYPVFQFNYRQEERRGPVCVCVCIHTVGAHLQGYTGPYQRAGGKGTAELFTPDLSQAGRALLPKTAWRTAQKEKKIVLKS